jgi:hypothetical protein
MNQSIRGPGPAVPVVWTLMALLGCSSAGGARELLGDGGGEASGDAKGPNQSSGPTGATPGVDADGASRSPGAADFAGVGPFVSEPPPGFGSGSGGSGGTGSGGTGAGGAGGAGSGTPPQAPGDGGPGVAPRDAGVRPGMGGLADAARAVPDALARALSCRAGTACAVEGEVCMGLPCIGPVRVHTTCRCMAGTYRCQVTACPTDGGAP